jgi:4-amino-4-deoxy-L-arabinose transferase-like glycosyltransferase
MVPVVLVGSAFLGLSVIANPGVALPFSIELIVLLALTMWGLSRERDPDIRRWLTRLAAATLALRLLLVLFVQFSPLVTPYFFAPDAIGYESVGRDISDYWAGIGFAPRAISEGWRPGYYHLNALFYTAFGDSRLALVVLNMFAGVWTALITFHLTRELLTASSAKAAAVLTGVFPSLVLWSILNIRDSLATFCTVVVVLYGLRLSRRFRPSHLWIFAVALLGLALLRDYMAFMVVLGLAIGTATAVRTERVFGTMMFGTVVALVLTYLANQVGLFAAAGPDGGVLETAQSLRTGLQSGAGSAFGVGAETTTVGQAIQYIPVGAALLLFAPFPWNIETALQAAAMPETLPWHPIFLLAILGLRVSIRNRVTVALVPLSVLLVVVSSYALVEGNFGTAYRHRAQIMPLFFIFSGLGFAWIKARLINQTRWWRTGTPIRSRI